MSLCASSDESFSESIQISYNTEEYVPSPDLFKTENLEDIWTILNSSRAFWNLPPDDSIDAKNDQDKGIIADETSSSDHDIDELPESDRMLSNFNRNSVQRTLDSSLVLERQNESVILKLLKMGEPLCHRMLLILVTLVPTSAIAVGTQYIGHCPANWLVPHLVLLTGVLSTVFMIYVNVNLYREHFMTSEDLNRAGKIFGWILGIFSIIEMTLFFDMPASFDTLSKNYCSKPFYLYTAFFNLFTIVTFFLGGLSRLIRLTGLPIPEDEHVF